MARLILEQDPPSQSIHAGVVGLVMLIFILLRVTTTRGFAALKPGFNTRAIVTWLSCSSLALLVLYNSILARTLYTESMAAYYTGPTMANRKSNPLTFPRNFTFTDMSGNSTWNVDTQVVPDGEQFYHILAMKPSALYNDEDLYYQMCLRIMLKAAQGGLLASLLLLNTYWCKHVEALVDEGDFMSNAEKYFYWILAVFALIVPVTTQSVLTLGFNDMMRGGNISDLLLLIGGTAVLVCYVITCRRLRALERDSRNVSGEDTSVTLQLSYYIYCIYWLIGSMVFIFAIGVLYRFDIDILKAQCNPVKAQIISDLEGATWNTVLIMVYPAAMFLLYPSVDVLTKPANDPAPHFQKRVRRVVKDAQRFRESLYIDGGGDSGSGSGFNGISRQQSSHHGLTTHSGLALQHIADNGQGHNDPTQQQQQQAQQRYSYIEPKRRDRMDSLTAMASEMHMIEQVNNGHSPTGSHGRNPSTHSSSHEPSPDGSKQGSWSGGAQTTAAADQDIERGTANRAKADNSNLAVGLSRRDSGSPSNYYEDSRDVETMKKWLAQNGELDRDSVIAGLEQTIHPDQQRSLNYAAFPAAPATPPNFTTTAASPEIASANPRRPSGEHYAMTSTSTSSNNNATSAAKTTTTAGPSGKPSAAPLAGILKTRNSTSSTRSSFGQNPFEQQHATAAANTGMGITPVYGVRTSSVHPQNQTGAGSRKSTENLPVKRRISNSSASKSNTTMTGPSPTMMSESSSTPSPSPSSSQQRRSNVTTRMDAGALAIAAHQHQQQQQQQKGRSSRDGMDIDYFGLRKASFDVHATATTPPPLPYEPQGQNVPPLDMIMSPTMTGFLMADPYPSAGTRYLDGEEQDFSLSDYQDDVNANLEESLQQLGRRSSGSNAGSGSSTPSSKRYRAPPPPIPTDVANAYRRTDVGSTGYADAPQVPVTPTTPVTPPGVRPRRSIDNVMDRQFLEMAKLMYEDHVVPDHILKSAISNSSVSSPAAATLQPPVSAADDSSSSTATTKTTTAPPTTPSAIVTALSPPPSSPPPLHSSASSPTSYSPFSMSASRTHPPPTSPLPPRPRHEDHPTPLFSPPPPPPQQQQQQQPMTTTRTPLSPQVAFSATAVPARHEPQPMHLPELPQRIPITPSPPNQQQQQQQQGRVMTMTPPAKSPYRVRESFETRMAAHSNPHTYNNPHNPTPSTTSTATSTATSSVTGRDGNGGGREGAGREGGGIQGPSAPSSPTSAPSIASTTSPTILSATTLPRPLTPAWYETKTSFASTNDVLNHYNAVTRGGSYHQKQQQQQQQLIVAEERQRLQKQQQQQQQQQSQFQVAPQQQQQPYYLQPSVGPLDEVPPPSNHHAYYQQQQQQSPEQKQQQPGAFYPESTPAVATPSRPQSKPSNASLRPSSASPAGQHQQPRTPSLEPRQGSTDSFGVFRRRSSSAHQHQQQHNQQQYYRRSKDELDLPIASAHQLHHVGDPSLYPIPTQQQGQLQLDRHSFIMPSESISMYSTWTGDLSDVTNTSGEVSVGAFLDRKHASTMMYNRRKSGEKLAGSGSHLSTSSVGTIHQALHGSGSGTGTGSGSGAGGSGHGSGGEEMRKSQYSLGSFGSRASAGAYSNYSNHSSGSGGATVSGPLSEAFGSGPVVVSASLSSVGQPSGSSVPGGPGASGMAAGAAMTEKQQQF
ncbi:hypothetical protein KI688_009899 [Linnemannia hyalina]|uniref:Uncharacterized protein n=1 Tax=Linnemannia hyalina TaxID=64524 RepID=A0A9P8BU63_9FUNG|nr:hypothetical protein KI688_009899 [Linnemannia hyalina]